MRQRGCESERAREEQHKTGIDRGIISDRVAKRKSATRETARKLLQISERYGAESAGKFSYSLNLIGSLTGFTLL